jgi:hypothetical protein
MNKKDYKKLIDSNKYQLFIFYSKANLPFVFALHPWFVCNEKGKLSRWEISYLANKDSSFGHLHKNSYPLFSGIDIFPFTFNSKLKWNSKLLCQYEGDLAKKIINFIKKSKSNYPALKDYSLVGPNSNTYVQWVLKNFKEIKMELPWNSFGKKTKI